MGGDEKLAIEEKAVVFIEIDRISKSVLEAIGGAPRDALEARDIKAYTECAIASSARVTQGKLRLYARCAFWDIDRNTVVGRAIASHGETTANGADRLVLG